MNKRRQPATFRIDPEEPRVETAKPRKPRVADPTRVEMSDIDIFDDVDLAEAEPPPAVPPRRRSRLRAVFLWSAGLLVSLAIGLWTERLVRELFARAEWLGWVGLALALVALAALVIIIVREAMALARRIAANPGPTLRLTKRLLREGQTTRLDTLLELSAAYQALAHKTEEHVEAVNAFVEKRQPRFD